MKDYPAAHSMDTTWFAVDADGKIGRFDTGEAGALPNNAATGGMSFEPSFDVVLREISPRIVMTKDVVEIEKLKELATKAEVFTESELWELLDGADRGLFDFGNDDYGNPGAYQRSRAPADPIGIDDVPEAIRGDVAALRLPVRFAETPEIHLADHMKEEDAQTWGDTGLRGDRVPPERPSPAKKIARPFDWRRILILLLAVLGIAWLLSRK